MTNEVSAGTKTMTIPLNTPERVSGKMIFTRTVRLFAPRSICIMKEPHIIQIFKDFLLHTSYYKLIYTVEETTELFRKSITQLTGQLSD